MFKLNKKLLKAVCGGEETDAIYNVDGFYIAVSTDGQAGLVGSDNRQDVCSGSIFIERQDGTVMAIPLPLAAVQSPHCLGTGPA